MFRRRSHLLIEKSAIGKSNKNTFVHRPTLKRNGGMRLLDGPSFGTQKNSESADLICKIKSAVPHYRDEAVFRSRLDYSAAGRRSVQFFAPAGFSRISKILRAPAKIGLVGCIVR